MTIQTPRYLTQPALALILLGGACGTSPKLDQTQTPAGLTQTVLGTAANFAVLGGSTVTNIGPSTIHGDLGVDPGLSITGFPPGLVTGTIHAGDAAAHQAQLDATEASI